MTTETSILRFSLPDLPGPVAALRMAMTQAGARQNAHSFISNMLRSLEKAGVGKETLDSLHNLAEHMLLDEAMEPYAIFSAARSCLSRDLMCPDDGDAATIDEIYGDGFAAALVASVPASYPRPVGTPGGTWPPGEWDDALRLGAFGGVR